MLTGAGAGADVGLGVGAAVGFGAVVGAVVTTGREVGAAVGTVVGAGVVTGIRACVGAGVTTGIGVAEENINTDYMSIYAIYDYDDDVEKVQAYSASMTLAVKVADMEIVGKVIDEAFAAGANTLNGISFSASDTAAAEKESLQAAVADARAKAEILAEAAGLKITGIELVSDGNVYSYDNSVGNFSAKRMEGAAMYAGYGTMVQAAKLIVSASVSITFTAE